MFPTPSLSSPQVLSLFTGALVLVLFANTNVVKRRRNPRRLPYPPGPTGTPFVGNLSHIPRVHAWLGYHEISREFGDILHLQVLGGNILVLSSMKRVNDLLEKRAINYSDRPTLPVNVLGGFTWSFSAMPYGSAWRKHRRVFYQHINQAVVPLYHPIMYEERANFLRRLKDKPGRWVEHLDLFFGTSIMRTTYGFEDIGKNASLIHDAKQLIQRLGVVNTPGRYLVNSFPLLKYIPEWVPGAQFQCELYEISQLNRKVVDTPFEDAQARFTHGQKGAYPSMASALVDNLPEKFDPEHVRAEDLAKGVCAITYIAGSETSIALAMALVCALANNPKVQERAQQELDAVIGRDRLPRIEDRPTLPHVNALIKELMRWFNPAPLAVPHSVMEDDEYDGYFIPKGSIILPNIWSIMHDPDVFEAPLEFIPERYLGANPAPIDPENVIFGFGRRVCPGVHFAQDAMFLFVASILANFTVAPPNDESGKPIKVELMPRETGTVAVPYPFECGIALRPHREGLLS